MTETRGRVIYHLMPVAGWREQCIGDGPIAADQLERHGFVHCCTREQILEIADWWLAGDAPLVAVVIDPDRVGDLRFERADLGREYPHVYNALPRAALVTTVDLPDTAHLPAEIADPPPAFRIEGVRGGTAVAVEWQGGRLIAGDDTLRADAEELVASGASVPQFPGVSTRASVATAYDAFCTVVALLDSVTRYRGDGFFDLTEETR